MKVRGKSLTTRLLVVLLAAITTLTALPMPVRAATGDGAIVVNLNAPNNVRRTDLQVTARRQGSENKPRDVTLRVNGGDTF